jgi:hypothetical protein
LSDLATTDTISSQAQVFRASKGWRLFFIILAPPLVIGSLGIAALPFFFGKPMPLQPPSFVSSLAGLRQPYRLQPLRGLGRPARDLPDRIRDVTPSGQGPLSQRHQRLPHLIRSGSRTLILTPLDPKVNKPIKTALLFERQDELFAWLSLHLTSLDAEARKKEAAELLQDPRLGLTPDEREARLRQVARWARLVNGFGVAAALWTLFYPRPDELAIAAAGLAPWSALAAVFLSGNLIRLDGKADSAYPNVGFAFLMPCVTLTLRAFTDYNIVSWQNFWPLFFLSRCPRRLCDRR